MERSLPTERVGLDILEEGRNAYGEVVARLSQMLEQAKLKVVDAVNYVISPPYNTPNGKPPQVRWYSQEELAGLRQRSEINQALDGFRQGIEAKKQNGGIPREYSEYF